MACVSKVKEEEKFHAALSALRLDAQPTCFFFIVAVQVGTMRKYQSTNKFYVVPYKNKNSDENSKPDITSEFQNIAGID